jgi:hypothetical protein
MGRDGRGLVGSFLKDSGNGIYIGDTPVSSIGGNLSVPLSLPLLWTDSGVPPASATNQARAPPPYLLLRLPNCCKICRVVDFSVSLGGVDSTLLPV